MGKSLVAGSGGSVPQPARQLAPALPLNEPGGRMALIGVQGDDCGDNKYRCLSAGGTSLSESPVLQVRNPNFSWLAYVIITFHVVVRVLTQDL